MQTDRPAYRGTGPFFSPAAAIPYRQNRGICKKSEKLCPETTRQKNTGLRFQTKPRKVVARIYDKIVFSVLHSSVTIPHEKISSV